MPKVFISYRRDDTAEVSGELGSRLASELGSDAVFIDVDDIPYGEDFRTRLSAAVSECDVLLAVIGRGWAGAYGDPAGGWRRRIDEPDDFVRIEVESALRRGIRVLPVLVGGASMPRERDLPAPLRELAFRNAAEVRSGASRQSDVDELIRAVAALLEAGPEAAPGAGRVADRAAAHWRFTHGGQEESERRRATVLFAELVGASERESRLDSEELFALVDECLNRLDSAALRHSGAVERMGQRIKATFGAPLALEGSPRAAINAAIEMRNLIGEYARQRGLQDVLGLRVGINTGALISRGAGGPGRAGVDVLGDAIGIAEVLVKAAPRQCIYVGSETWRAAREEFEWRRIVPLGARGDEEVGEAHEVVSSQLSLHRPRSKARARFASPLVGRAAELAALRQCLSRLRAGRGGIATITGDAGLGKSRLVGELAACDEARGLGWLEGRSLAIGSTLSFHAFSDLLRSWARVSGDEDAGAAQQRVGAVLQELLGDESEQLLPFVLTLMGLPLDDRMSSRLHGIGSEAMQNLVIRTMTRLLVRMAEEEPRVLVFEDLHWADASSIELLASLLRLAAEHRILFVLVQRRDHAGVEPITSACRKLDADRVLALELKPLDRSSSEELLERLIGRGDVPHAVVRRIDERTAGNPFYAEEVIYSLLEEGALEARDDGLWATESIESAVIPDTVRETILVRVDRLGASAKRVLRAASVVGQSTAFRILARVAEGTDLEQSLEELSEGQFLIRRERHRETFYEFRHPLIQEVTYETLTGAARREQHRQIAVAIEAARSESDSGYYGMLAYHFMLAAEMERAEKYIMLAGDEASRLAASSEALHFFQEASRLFIETRGEAADPHERAQLEKRLAFAFFNRGKMPEGDEHFDRALALLGQRTPGASRLRRLARFALAGIRVLVDLYVARDPQRKPAASKIDLEVIELMYGGALAQITANPTGFLFDSIEGLERLNRVDPTTVPYAGGIYAGAANIFSYAGLSFAISGRLLEVAESLVNRDDPRELFLYRAMNFIRQFLRGDWDERHVVDEALVQENIQLGELWIVINYLPQEAMRRLHQGSFAAAAAELEQITKIGELYDYDLARSNELAVKMFLLLEQRKLPEALEVAGRYYESFDEDLLNLLALSTRAKIELLLNDLDAAARSLERAGHIVRRQTFVMPFHVGGYWLSRFQLELARWEAALAADDRSRARVLRRSARRMGRRALAKAEKVAWRRPEAYRLLGRCAWLGGRQRQARVWWTRSVREAERLGTRPELGRACLEAGSRLRAAGSRDAIEGNDADRCIDGARGIFEELELSWDLERLAEATAQREDPPASAPT